MSLHIVPFEPWHLDQITPRGFEAQEMNALPDWRERAQFYQKAGPAWTGLVGDEIMGSCGLIILWNGVAEAWLVSTDMVPKYALSFHRAIKNNIDRVVKDLRLRRIQVAIDIEHIVSRAWIQRLGFQYEGYLPCYGPDGSDYVRYGRISRAI